jgi:hypothetical protein
VLALPAPSNTLVLVSVAAVLDTFISSVVHPDTNPADPAGAIVYRNPPILIVFSAALARMGPPALL